MKQKTIIIVLALLIAMPTLCFGQFFQGLYDVDSTQEWGVNIFVQPDANYFITGTGYNPVKNNWSLFTMQVSADGSAVLSKHVYQHDSVSIYSGNAGEAKIVSGGYITPVSIQVSYGAYSRSRAGIIKYNAIGDTIFLKTYTDTSIYFDALLDCAVMPDGGYILGGEHGLNVPSYYPGYIVRTNSSGDTLWTHTYQETDTEASVINNVIPLPDGRIVAAGYSVRLGDAGGIHHLTYYHNAPWFMLLDAKGNIIRDTFYANNYLVGSNICGELYPDMNGGYIHIGTYDSLATEYPDDLQNFPAYVAHLDTNFRITWIVELNYSDHYGHRQGCVVHQLKDSSYVITGDDLSYYAPPGQMGFAAKISRDGKLLWSHSYYNDTTQIAYLRDVAEKPDGSLVFTGKSFNDTLPAWHQHGDVWLLGVDSNGCLMAGGCDPDTSNGVIDTTTAVKKVVNINNAVQVYPNPSTGTFTVHITTATSELADIVITNMVGQQVQEIRSATNANIEVNLQQPAGIYFLSAAVGGNRYVVKVVTE